GGNDYLELHARLVEVLLLFAAFEVSPKLALCLRAINDARALKCQDSSFVVDIDGASDDDHAAVQNRELVGMIIQRLADRLMDQGRSGLGLSAGINEVLADVLVVF